MKFYLQVQSDDVITDAIEYAHGNYVEHEAEFLPAGVNGGWFKLENGVIVEHLELKPVSPEDEINLLKERVIRAEKVASDNSIAQQELVELLVEMAVI